MIDEDFYGQHKSDNLVSFEEAARIIGSHKKQGKVIGLCHGAFDVLHVGHVKHFESAKKMCDILVVSVTSDRFVTLRKGKDKPVFSERLRAYAVASIRYVDYVVISDFEQATEVIKKLKPSLYIKGPDFANKTTPGIISERVAINAVGGEIKYTSDKKFSTTDIIAYIKDNVNRERILLVIDRDGTLIDDVGFLGKNPDWKRQAKLKKDVIDLLIHLRTKYDVVSVVMSNQQGVARGFFDVKTVEEINGFVAGMLRAKGVVIDAWRFCPDVDESYAARMKNISFNPAFVKRETHRKPSPFMLTDALNSLGRKLSDFNKVVVIGNSSDDAATAAKINAAYIDVTGKGYASLKEEAGKILE